VGEKEGGHAPLTFVGRRMLYPWYQTSAVQLHSRCFTPTHNSALCAASLVVLAVCHPVVFCQPGTTAARCRVCQTVMAPPPTGSAHFKAALVCCLQMFEPTWYKCRKLHPDLAAGPVTVEQLEADAHQHILNWLGGWHGDEGGGG
jgi:hypothetical protein